MRTSRDAAVDLARRGFRVFRLGENTLRPIKPKWTETASSDPDAVFRDFSDALGESVVDNIGVLTGGDLLVVDVDVKAGRRGLLSLTEMACDGLPLETLTVRTPSGGLHKYYRIDPEFEYRQQIGWREGIDIKSHHNYVVAPGSSRPDGVYEIIDDLPRAPLDEHHAGLFRRPKGAARAELDAIESKYEDDWSIAEAIRVLEACEAVEGSKHNDLVAAIHTCFDLGVTPTTLLGLIPQHVGWFAALYTQDLEAEIASIVRGRVRDGKQWGGAHIRGAFEPCLGAGLKMVSLAEFEGKAVPARQWLVPGLIPHRTVTLLSGDGGVGKTLLSLQLGAAIAAGLPWIGLDARKGPIIYASAEDEIDEIHRRMEDIRCAAGLEFSDLADFHVVPLAGEDAVMGALNGRTNKIVPTPLWRGFADRVRDVEPAAVFIDTLADAYGAGENTREHARQFIQQLRGLALKWNCAVILLGHPSLAGIASGTGTSGSTGWSNSVRSRLYLRRPEKEDAKRDPNLRILETMKANYAAGVGDERRLRWEAGRFVPVEDRVTVDGNADELFLLLLTRFTAQGREISPEPRADRYAPKFFADTDEARAGGVDEKAFKSAMERLFRDETIAAEKYGPPSKKWRKIVLARKESAC